MVNDDDLAAMSPFERQALRDLRAIALWSLVTALTVIGIPIVIVILAVTGFWKHEMAAAPPCLPGAAV